MKIRIVNLKKFVVSIMVLLGIILAFFTVLSSSTYSYGEVNYKTRYVANGETLWNIAKEQLNENEYYSNKDIRFIVEDIKETNNLKNCSLKINQELKIPNY